MKTPGNIIEDAYGRQGEDGFPEPRKDWASWACPGCGDELRALKVPEVGDFPSLGAYIDAKACSDCLPGLLCQHLPRDEILAAAGVRQHERGQKFSPELASNPGEKHLPRDRHHPDRHLEEWPFADGEFRSVVLTGSNGTGKTMLAVQLLVQAYRAGNRSVAFFSCDEIVREHFAVAAWEEKEKRDRASRCGCLVLDEYGRGQHSNTFAYGLVGSVIDARQHHLTIITSNLRFASKGDEKSFEETDSAVFDRLTQGLVIPVLGPSRRGRR